MSIRGILTAAALVVGFSGLGAPAASATTQASFGIVNNNSHLCLSVPGASTGVVGLNQFRCGGFPDQFWHFGSSSDFRQDATGRLYFHIINDHSGLCVAVPGASTTPGTQVNQFPCGGFGDHYWHVENRGATVNIINFNSRQCLSVPGARTDETAPVNQFPCGDFPDQFWSVR
jgi:hypothetical protein